MNSKNFATISNLYVGAANIIHKEFSYKTMKSPVIFFEASDINGNDPFLTFNEKSCCYL